MGGTNFEVTIDGVDVADCYKRAVEEAEYSYGHEPYSGTIKEKDGYVVVDRTVRTEQEADTWIQQVYNDYGGTTEAGAVCNDKWGPAAAIPIARATHVSTGDEINRIITFESAPVDDYDKLQQTYKTAAEAVRLKSDERLISWSPNESPVVTKERVNTTAGKLKTKTKFIVTGTASHATWTGGFDSQAEARAFAVAEAKKPRTTFHGTRDSEFEVQSITRREDGTPLVRVHREVLAVRYSLKVVILKGGPKQEELRANAWLFFGIASC